MKDDFLVTIDLKLLSGETKARILIDLEEIDVSDMSHVELVDTQEAMKKTRWAILQGIGEAGATIAFIEQIRREIEYSVIGRPD